MVGSRQRGGPTTMSGEPYTHAIHAAACRAAALDGRVLVQLVQVRRGPVVYCARLREPYTVPGGPDCWSVEAESPERLRLTVPVKNVRACGGPDCSCQLAGHGDDGKRSAAASGAASTPQGLTCQ